MSMNTILIFIAFLYITDASDYPCTSRSGQCQEDNLPCSGSYYSGLCSGDASRRCCLASDYKCTSGGGQCQEDNLSCAGFYHTGLCSGSASRRCCLVSTSTCCEGVTIYSRSSWGARQSKGVTTMPKNPVDMFFVHHTAGSTCHELLSCAKALRGIQNYHMDKRGWDDIGYSFLVGEDGNVYEGRGWNRVGAHTKGYNSVAYAASVMGNYTTHTPNCAAQTALKGLIRCGKSKGYISSSYRLYGHRDAGQTSCPGDAFYKLIQTWPHYSFQDP